jgi:YtkA-like protein
MKLRATTNCSALVLAAALAVGCGGQNGAADPSVDGSALYSCATETRAVPYTADLSRPSLSGNSTVILMKIVPATLTKGLNDWTVKILDASGAPEGGLTIKAVAWMPDHGHGPSVQPVVTPVNGQSGVYLATPVDFFMAGYWEVTFTWQPATGAQESAVFPICIPG